MTLEFDRYVTRIASAAVDGNNGFQSEQERDLLREAVVFLREVCAWWENIIQSRQKCLCMVLDENAPAQDGAYASAAVGDSFSITISISFLHNLVSDSARNIASLPGYNVRKSILSATALIFFHELSHVIFGHTETLKPEPSNYRIDEASADFRSGILFVKTIMEYKPFSARLTLQQPDDISRYAQFGALVLHRFLHNPEATSNCYHGSNNRFLTVCAGYMYMAAANRLSDPHRLNPITQALERAVEESHDSGWRKILRQDSSDNWQLLTQTAPNYHARADEYDKKSSIAGAILRSIKNSDVPLDRAIERTRKLFGADAGVLNVADTNALREARSRIIVADKLTRPKLNPSTLDTLVLIVEFGRRGDLTDEEANEAAEFITQIGRIRPTLLVVLSIGGFDEDIRQLIDIPECAQHFRQLFKALKQFDPVDTEPAVLEQIESQSRVLLSMAMGHAPRSALDIRPTNDIELLQKFLIDLDTVRKR